MSTTTTPKPPGRRTPGANSTPTSTSTVTPPSNSNGTPNRSPTRMAAQTSSTASSTVNRARSVRSGTPLYARAAARKPAGNNEGDDDAKAELQGKLDELQEKLAQAEQACEESRKQGDVLQIRLDEALREQGMLEESVHEHTERIEELEMERKEHVRARRELEQIYEAERAQAMKEKELAAAEKEESAHGMQRLKEALAQRELRERTGVEDDHRRHSLSRTSSHRSADPSPTPESRGDRQFAPPSSLQRSDSRSSSRLVLQKDKIIEGLRLELAEAQIKLVELENQGGGTLHQLEKDMYDIKMQNARLMEENESFQLLLSEKTLNGDLAQSDLLRAPSNTEPATSRPSSAVVPHGASLADELEGHDSAVEDGEGSTTDRRLQLEVNSLKDQNKALTLYINNIISRLLQHEQFEAILDKTPDLMAGPGAVSRKYAGQEVDKELPPPPPPHQQQQQPDDQQPTSLLQRAGSVLRRKPARPTSQIVNVPPPSASDQDLARFEEQQTTVHENPDTAPSIPLARSSSMRTGAVQHGHRRSRSDWPAASVVTSMYKGPPSSATAGPLSPGLSSPPARGSSFFAPQPMLGGRAPSAGSVPTTISETEIDSSGGNDKENLSTAALATSYPRDSKFPLPDPSASPDRRPSMPASHRSSVISNPGERFLDIEGAASTDASNPSSPPRSIASSGDTKDSGKPVAGAVMMGSKPRPLRLVQETQSEEEKARKAGNRGSWFGWMNKGMGPPGGFAPG